LFRHDIKYSSSELLLFGRQINSIYKQTFLAKNDLVARICRTYG